jgi:cytochrome bd-type quinol oxidase subunit 1
MDVTAGLMTASNPFAALTFIAAPALLTNASSLLLLGTSNRLARAVDRVRALASHLEHHSDTESRIAQLELRQMQSAERRVLIIVRAMTAFYLAVGSFAFGTMLALVGATLVTPDHEVMRQWVMRFTIAACVIGVAAIMSGSLSLVFESRLTFRILRVEADLVRERYAHKNVA